MCFGTHFNTHVLVRPGGTIGQIYEGIKDEIVSIDHKNIRVVLAAGLCNLTEKVSHENGTELRYIRDNSNVVDIVSELKNIQSDLTANNIPSNIRWDKTMLNMKIRRNKKYYRFNYQNLYDGVHPTEELCEEWYTNMCTSIQHEILKQYFLGIKGNYIWNAEISDYIHGNNLDQLQIIKLICNGMMMMMVTSIICIFQLYSEMMTHLTPLPLTVLSGITVVEKELPLNELPAPVTEIVSHLKKVITADATFTYKYDIHDIPFNNENLKFNEYGDSAFLKINLIMCIILILLKMEWTTFYIPLMLVLMLY
ncbi:unnamed protein product [Mytilus edulis]|uniref:Uncharacterized protein n=1 Tax=Mytilus edulis TaxID=6550 RepID=A0A8S3R4N2_MYTED|nr:unnamed protein product [Mytilus edulis]